MEAAAINYYEHHLGDYAKDTSHLSLLEHGVYRRLLDRYYGTEQPIPHGQAYRLVGARTNEEQEAVDVVLSEFFEDTPEGFRHARCDAEIARFREKQDKAKASAAARWSSAKPSECERNANAMRTQCDGNAPNHQTPVTSNHTKAKARADAPAASGSRLPAGWTLPDDWRQWAEAERPEIDASAEAAKFADYWHAQAGAKGRKADWPATWRNWIRNSRTVNARAGPNRAPSKHLTGMAGFMGVDPNELARSNANPRLVHNADPPRADDAVRALPARLSSV